MRDGAIVQVGTAAEVVGAPADDYVARLRREVPRSHVLTLRWVMRPPRPGEPLDGPAMPADRIIRDAARGRARLEHPVRVFDGDELVGVVDQATSCWWWSRTSCEIPTRAPCRSPEAGCGIADDHDSGPAADHVRPRPSAGRPDAGLRWQLLAVFVVWLLGWALWRGRATLAPGAELTDFQLWLNSVRDAFDRRPRDSFFFEYFINGIAPSSTRSWSGSATLISQPASPRRCRRSAGSAWSRCSPGSPSRWPGCVRRCWYWPGLLAFGFLGYCGGQPRHAGRHVGGRVRLCDHRDPAGHLGWPAARGQRRDHPGPRRDADDALVRLPGAAGAGVRHRPGVGRRGHLDLRAAAGHPDHRARHPQRSPTTIEAAARWGPAACRSCARCSCRWRGGPSSWGSTSASMAALSMATIAALINGPGLGQPVAQALQSLDVGNAFVSGLAIVIMAIVLDRVPPRPRARQAGGPRSARAAAGTGGSH